MRKNPEEIQLIKHRRQNEIGGIFRQGCPRVALLYPSPYRAAMSSLGYQWILSLLQHGGFSPERVILPDDLDAWKKTKSPLLSYETLTPLSNFPVIAVSLAYELELAGLIQALEMSGIPAKREERGPYDPLIILGGPLTFSNPLPASPFVDAMLLGEAEEVIVPAVRAAFDSGREGWLDEIQNLDGGFVPERMGHALPQPAKSSDVLLPARSHIISADAELKNMFLIEGERGCHRTCSFCVMRRSTNGGMRLVTPERLVSLLPKEAKKVGLVGAAISDHPKLVPLLDTIVSSGREVGISSLRADRISLKPDIARLLRKGGYRTLTVASDAASQRLRREISKGTLEKHLFACAEQASEHRYRVLKIYMMLGLPGETMEDIDELIRFTLEISKIHPVALGIAPFVAKRNTPMDGEAFAGIKLVDKRLKYLEKGLKASNGRATIRSTSTKWAWVEYMLAQGGRASGLAVYDAIQNGTSFSKYKAELSKLEPVHMAPWRVQAQRLII